MGEEIYVIEGELKGADGTTIGPGIYIYIQAWAEHGPFEATKDTLALVRYTGAPVVIEKDGTTLVLSPTGAYSGKLQK